MMIGTHAAIDRFLALTNCAIAGLLWLESWIGLIAASCDHCDASGDFWGTGGFEGYDDGTWAQWGRDSLGEQSYNKVLLVLCLVPFSVN